MNDEQLIGNMILAELADQSVGGVGGYYEDDGISDVMEVGRRRRGGRRFGRALGAIFTGGASEMGRAVRRRRQARRGGGDDVVELDDLQPDLQQQIAAQQAINRAEAAQLGFKPKTSFSGLFGIQRVTVPAAGGIAVSKSTAEEPTQIFRLILSAQEPTGVVTPTDALAWVGVTDIKLGSQSIFNNVEPVALAALANVAVLAGLSTRIISPGQSLYITYRNDHPALAMSTSGAAFGPQG